MADHDWQIVRVLPAQAGALSGVAWRAKAYWGYDASFMAACADVLRVDAAHIAAYPYYAAMRENQVLGFYGLHDTDREARLDALFVEPDWIGRGIGGSLWEHLVAQARTRTATAILIDSDPFAQGFYLSRGAVQVGEVASTAIPGRSLPLLRYPLI